MPTSCQFAAFSATYTPHTLEVLERRFGAKAVYLTATTDASDEVNGAGTASSTRNKVPSNIKVYNLRVAKSVANQTSLLKQVRAKLKLLEPLLKPLLPTTQT